MSDLTSDPLGFFDRHRKKTIIDEAQKVFEIFSYLQEIVDEKRQMGIYIFTESHS